MKKPQQPQAADKPVLSEVEGADAATLKRELDKGIGSGISKRTPAQIRADFRRAREAA